MRTEIVTLTASALINAGVLFSMDHAAVQYDRAHRVEQQRLAAKRGADALDFEFVEAPPVAHAQRPRQTRRIADRDSLNQDRTGAGKSPQDAPQAKTPGLAAQLMQLQGKPFSVPSPASSPSPASPPAPQDQTPQEKKTEPGMTDETRLVRAADLAPAQPPSKPSPALQPNPAAQQGMGGVDRITASEMSRTRSHGAQLYGVTSFEATGSGMGVYIRNMKEKIWLSWFPYLVVHYPKDFKSADALMSFTLDVQGNIKTVKILEQKGSPLFAAFCAESIQRVGSFGPLPREILDLTGKDELEIKFAFHYW